MIVYLHGFDWATYEKQVMPAFARWLITKDEGLVLALFEQTRCAQEETYLPAPMRNLRSWLRAQLFVEKLPRGAQSRKEYEQLCSVAQFTALNDRYLHRHIPQLYQNSDALRTIWGAIIETHCLPWRRPALSMAEDAARPLLYTETANASNVPGETITSGTLGQDEQEIHDELVSLLKAAGLADLAHEVDELAFPLKSDGFELIEIAAGALSDTDKAYKGENRGRAASDTDKVYKGENRVIGKLSEIDDDESVANEDDPAFSTQVGGVEIGGTPNLLHLRGWLAGTSLRAMALFEYLACGRRIMPFGYVTGEPYNYIGYLTPGEVQHLATCLEDAQPPAHAAAQQDQEHFHQQLIPDVSSSSWESFRLVDEVLPLHAGKFLQAIRSAAAQQIGLICCEE